MTSMQRVLTCLGHQEPDRVPMFLLATMHGAKELGLDIETYFSRAQHVIEGQLRLLKKYRSDCLYPFFYAPLEVEAFGGRTVFVENGPPNSGQPVIGNQEQISSLIPPDVSRTQCLSRVLDTIHGLKSKVGDTIPIIGVVMSPFSLPVMQMGFDHYIELIHGAPKLFDRLMAVNESFCVAWANAQLAAGATAICYFDPLSSPTNIPRDLFQRTGLQIAKRTLAKIHGPAAIHLASGRGMPIMDDLAQTGAAVVGVSALEKLDELKKSCAGRLTVLGNLNGVAMRHWSARECERQVKDAIRLAGRGGGFILADNHGEIPFQVPDEVLLAIGDAVDRWGRYPLHWHEESLAEDAC
ncbi:MAG: uroporphyrinogen decarboxylase family protein [Magnetococcales bacterium]|nr:uroporphyrinogen decarboxylase family protein [Magnetococcales bacterium]MBF0151479.1 uroporphyrinogen decarboxylase family protein [Magnetococcales bacterium]MBF0173104.1 uroporphyrinogen decarboxylase family protein [Magnetococcales bacterium]MBF0346245.1 uroporphyrinogen decarboxylase family protein [Magnetococcales bacterium]MBF0632528.1 uroporphyrinogen decarboxylase family protein [Magnetococcales bacterium]